MRPGDNRSIARRERQFVVITAGGHDGVRSSLGDHVIAYALPSIVTQDVVR